MKALNLMMAMALSVPNAFAASIAFANEDAYYRTDYASADDTEYNMDYDEEGNPITDEDSEPQISLEPAKRFTGGSIYVRRSFDMKKAGYNSTHASKTFEMFTPNIDQKFNDAKKLMVEAHTKFPNSPAFLQAFGNLVDTYKNVPKCQLGVETGSKFVSFQQGREYNITPANDPKNPNRFNIEVKFENGGTRDAFLDCSPMMSEEDVIAALDAFGFSTNPGKSITSAPDKNMTEGELMDAPTEEELREEAPSYYKENPIYSSESGLFMGGSKSRSNRSRR